MNAPIMRSLVAGTSALKTVPRRTAMAALRNQSAFSTAIPRRTQHESTETPARAHRSPSSTRGTDPMSGEPTNSSTEFRESSSDEHLSRLRDIAFGAQPGPGTSPPSGADAGDRSGSRKASTTPQPIFPPTIPLAAAGYGYTAGNLPTKSDDMIESFINHFMRHGKKTLATKHVLKMMKHISIALNADPLPALTHAIELASPMVGLQSRKSGAKVTQIPMALTTRQMRRKAIVGIIRASHNRSDREVDKRLAKEVLAILEGNSEVLRKKEEIHREAVRNRSNIGVRV